MAYFGYHNYLSFIFAIKVGQIYCQRCYVLHCEIFMLMRQKLQKIFDSKAGEKLEKWYWGKIRSFRQNIYP